MDKLFFWRKECEPRLFNDTVWRLNAAFHFSKTSEKYEVFSLTTNSLTVHRFYFAWFLIIEYSLNVLCLDASKRKINDKKGINIFDAPNLWWIFKNFQTVDGTDSCPIPANFSFILIKVKYLWIRQDMIIWNQLDSTSIEVCVRSYWSRQLMPNKRAV